MNALNLLLAVAIVLALGAVAIFDFTSVLAVVV